MPKIKLINLHSDYYDDNSRHSFGDGLTEWEEVSNEDLKLIKANPHFITGTQFVIIEDVTEQIPKILLSIKELIQKQKQLQKERDEAQSEREKKRKKNAETKKIEKARKQIEKAQQILKEKGLL